MLQNAIFICLNPEQNHCCCSDPFVLCHPVGAQPGLLSVYPRAAPVGVSGELPVFVLNLSRSTSSVDQNSALLTRVICLKAKTLI